MCLCQQAEARAAQHAEELERVHQSCEYFVRCAFKSCWSALFQASRCNSKYVWLVAAACKGMKHRGALKMNRNVNV